MDISFIVILWVIISIAQAINDRKKAPPPPQIPPQDSTGLDFEIPTIRQPDEVEEFDIEEIYQRRKQSENAVASKVQPETKIETFEENKIELDLTPAAMMNSIIMNEILDKPKALRKRR